MENDEFELSLALSDNLKRIKRIVPHAKDFEDLEFDPYDPEFPALLRDAMQRAKTIHFNISDMVMLSGPRGVLTETPSRDTPGSTNWELRTIWDEPNLLKKTIFYWSGSIISTEDIKRLP